MKVTIGLIMALAAPWVISTTASAIEEGTPQATNRVVVVTPGADAGAVADAANGNVQVFVAGADATGTWNAADGTEHHIEVVVNKEGDANAPGVIKVRRIANAEASADAANRGWLGVVIEQVNEALDTQLNLQGTGMTIANVVKDSPADRAGLAVHDVVLAVDGQMVDGQVSAFVDAIKSRVPGDTVQVRVLRDGQEQVVPVVLGSRAEMPATMFKTRLPEVELGEIEEHIRTRGKFIQRGPQGEWVVKELGDLDNLADLPQEIREILPGEVSVTTQVFVTEDGTKVQTRTQRDGSSLSVEREGDGPIVVTRTSAAGEEDAQSYATEEDLKASDVEAYDLFNQSDRMVMVQIDGDMTDNGLQFLSDDGKFDIELNLQDLHDGLMQWHSAMGQEFGQAQESYQKALDELRAAMDRLRNEGILSEEGLAGLRGLLNHQGAVHAFAMPLFSDVQRTIKAMPDGTIEVRTRSGGDEVIDVYANEADLQARNPEAYDRYVDLLNASESDRR
ncbi:MAG: PDZ domain-containing protein [Phycisphaerae bacterium]|nr:PDZ domain-containing protein [Phycisphaerae bacterium]